MRRVLFVFFAVTFAVLIALPADAQQAVQLEEVTDFDATTSQPASGAEPVLLVADACYWCYAKTCEWSSGQPGECIEGRGYHMTGGQQTICYPFCYGQQCDDVTFEPGEPNSHWSEDCDISLVVDEQSSTEIGYCPDDCPEPLAPVPDPEEIASLIATGDFASLAALVEQKGVEPVSARYGLVVTRSCDGTPAAFLPMGTNKFAALVDSLGARR